MNKENLFYIVYKGTNVRVLNKIKEPVIITKDGISFQERCYPKDEYDIVSIKEYEDTYVELVSNKD